MKWQLAATVFVVSVAASAFATASQTKTSAHKRTSASVHRSHKAHSKTSVRHTSRVAHSHSRRRSRVHRAAAPSYQLHPDPERYRQIQQALADRGYFKGDVDGVWGPDSESALQRFQTDKKLPNDGQINALSLIALGLGPKHNSVIATAPPLAAPAPSTSPRPPSSASSAPPPAPSADHVPDSQP